MIVVDGVDGDVAPYVVRNVAVAATSAVVVTVAAVLVAALVEGGHASSFGMQSVGPLQARPIFSGGTITLYCLLSASSHAGLQGSCSSLQLTFSLPSTVGAVEVAAVTV